MSTEYTKIEPMQGFGKTLFGNKSEKEEIEYGRGFGDPTTDYIEVNDD